MARGEVRSASVAWATHEEIARGPAREMGQAEVAQPAPKPERDRGRLTPTMPEWGQPGSLKARVRAASEAQ
jgi:hypothetical protein